TGKTSDELRALIKKPGTWLDGRQAVEHGFADVLIEPLEAAAHLSENRQKELLNMPEQVKGLMSPKAQVPNPSPTPNGNERVAAIQNVFAYA
ncbi:Clp protease ClpP, partial [Escherichia coli]|nr:Clp protease ClpP [Escherichia coli]